MIPRSQPKTITSKEQQAYMLYCKYCDSIGVAPADMGTWRKASAGS